MTQILMIHGIGQQQETADTLEAALMPALSGGIRIAGFAEEADRLRLPPGRPERIEARVAFYGDLFLAKGSQGEGMQDLDPDQQGLADALAIEMLENVAARSRRAQARVVAERELRILHPAGGEAQGPGAVARVALNSLAKVPWIAPIGMNVASWLQATLVQVTRYLSEPALREEIQRRVAALLGEETSVMIGHSLGSVVAYEAAHRLRRPLPLLVTLGSPLGLRHIVHGKLVPPASYPAKVRHWVNVADRDDYIAAEPDLGGLFSEGKPADATFDAAWTVDNEEAPHSLVRYLGKRQVGQPVGKALRSPA